MQLNFEDDGQTLIAKIEGRLDTITAPEAETQLMEQIEAGRQSVVVDMAETEYVSSSGLRVLLKAAKRLQRDQGAYALCAANQQVLEVLEISGFLTILKHFPTREEAVGFVR